MEPNETMQRLLERMAALEADPARAGRALVLAVDGRAAAGKSTLAAALSARLLANGGQVTPGGAAAGGTEPGIEDAAAAGRMAWQGVFAAPEPASLVVHADDFFLPPELRTPERYAQPGGNFHRERFAAEVLSRLRGTDAFAYRVFDCGVLALRGSRRVAAGRWRIVEGAYCLHPALGDYADLTVFLDVAPAEQLRRVEVRGGAEKAAVFAARWIPLEEAYHAACSTRQRADLVLEL